MAQAPVSFSLGGRNMAETPYPVAPGLVVSMLLSVGSLQLIGPHGQAHARPQQTERHPEQVETTAPVYSAYRMLLQVKVRVEGGPNGPSTAEACQLLDESEALLVANEPINPDDEQGDQEPDRLAQQWLAASSGALLDSFASWRAANCVKAIS